MTESASCPSATADQSSAPVIARMRACSGGVNRVAQKASSHRSSTNRAPTGSPPPVPSGQARVDAGTGEEEGAVS
ncbi:hypothetical protein [Corynebacterium variabile]